MSVLSTAVRVLLLEDSELDAALIEDELRRGRVEFTLTRVETRTGFLEALHHFRPAVIFADCKLPAFSGVEALEIARNDAPHVPFVFVSGTVGEEAAVELLKAGATDFVLKDGLVRLIPVLNRALKEVQERLALESAQAELSSCNSELEQRVLDRTLELSAKNAIMEEDLRMAHELQIALLPRRFPTLPKDCPPSESAVRISSLYRSSHMVSGDCFNVTRLSDTKLSVFICDVMGHGVRAALVTAMLRTLEEQLGEKAADPALLLGEMNRAQCHIFEEAETLVFATACSMTVDVAAGTLTVANAGHPCPLLVSGAQKGVTPLSASASRGPALGIFSDAVYHNELHPLAKDDLILLFTDGLFEVENADAELFSEDRLRETVAQHTELPPDPLVAAVVHDVELFTGRTTFPDDICVVAVQVARLTTSASSAA